MEERKFFVTDNQYLAMSLSFLGFRFFKNGIGKDTTYSFENTNSFQNAMKDICNLKNKYR